METLEIIKLYRKKNRLTQNEMAQRLNMSRTTYQAIELGVNNLKVDDFFEIIRILNIPLTAFSNDSLVIIPEIELNKLKNASIVISNAAKDISEITKSLMEQGQYSVNRNTIQNSTVTGDIVFGDQYKK